MQAAQYDADGYLAEATYRETCKKCGGTGRFRLHGGCFACKGVGFREYRHDAATREKNRARTAARKERIAADTFSGFKAANPEVADWIEANRASFGFAESMHEAVTKFGDLTAGQSAAVWKCIDARKAREDAQKARAASAPAVETDKLMSAFDAALKAGLKRPKMRFEGFQASLAPATGKNAGAIYLKDGEAYLGKIVGGKLHATRDCSDEKTAAIRATMADPLAAAVAFGKRTGECSCCGRELTNHESIDRGIGPICAGKFGL